MKLINRLLEDIDIIVLFIMIYNIIITSYRDFISIGILSRSHILLRSSMHILIYLFIGVFKYS